MTTITNRAASQAMLADTPEAASWPEIRPLPYRKGSPSLFVRLLRKLGIDAHLKQIEEMVLDRVAALKPYIFDREVISGNRIRQIFEGECTSSPDNPVAIYAHYTRSGRVTPMVFQQIKSYRDLGFTVVFVTMCERLNQNDLERLRSLCFAVATRRSFGRDFGAWADMWPYVKQWFPRSKESLLVNDSVLGPVRPLAPIVGSMRAHTGVIGLTESIAHFPHIQSYFLLIRGDEANESLGQFLSQLQLSASKKTMIVRGELGLARFMASRGIPMRAAFPYEAVETFALRDSVCLDALRVCFPGLVVTSNTVSEYDLFRLRKTMFDTTVNPTHHMWRCLIKHFGFPFIKTELLLQNPSKIPDICDWHEVIGLGSPVPISEIEAHLAEVSRGAPLV